MTQALLKQITSEIEADILAHGEYIDKEERANHWMQRTSEVMDAYRAMPAATAKEARSKCFNRALKCGASLENLSYTTRIPMGVCVRFAQEFDGIRLSQQREVYDFKVVKETARIKKLVRAENQDAILEYPELWELQQTYNEAADERRSILNEARHSNRRSAGIDELVDAREKLRAWVAYEFLGNPAIDQMVEHADEMHKAALSGRSFNPFTGEYEGEEVEEPLVQTTVKEEHEDEEDEWAGDPEDWAF